MEPTAGREERPSISIFVPAHNEAGNIAGAIEDIVWAAEGQFRDYEILLVNDGSTDGTGEIAETLTAKNSRIKVLHHPQRCGIAAGYQTALREAKKDFISYLPGDREIRAESVRDILSAVGKADIVAPYHQNSRARAIHRRVMTYVYTTLCNFLFGQNVRYFQGPIILPTVLARTIPIRCTGFAFVTEVLVHALHSGLSYVEVGLSHQERLSGRSKSVSLSNMLIAVKTIFRLWWNLRIMKTVYFEPPAWVSEESSYRNVENKE